MIRRPGKLVIRRPMVAAVCLASLAASLSGCVSNVPGTAAKDPDAAPWITPLGEDDLDGVLLNIEDLNKTVGATDMVFFREEDNLIDLSEGIKAGDCLGSFNAGEISVYEDSDYTVAENRLANEPGDVNEHWVQETVVLFPSEGEAQAFYDESQKNWENCNQEQVETADSENKPVYWQVDDVEVEESTMSQYMEQNDSVGPWGCDHTMSLVANVILEAIVCKENGSDAARELNQVLVENATNR